jgi:hypothetical protein
MLRCGGRSGAFEIILFAYCQKSMIKPSEAHSKDSNALVEQVHERKCFVG